ncbi:DUF547 domain-containing protein [Vibrio sp. S4M6]|uniref:DUF547 domain-containing protein n=1 Tax=Vibrio sinus TaxID=2946865 RepID=UPI00202A3F0F|nr:DUF547 domain-containing protein [Vibrio sinus]MCL9781578.1 DUF547 domain-containing protein [Vibrio sinus]
MKYLLAIWIAMVPFFTLAAPKAELWPYWNQSNEQNTSTISYQAWQSILDKYLIEKGHSSLFEYDKVSKQDKEKLQQFLTNMAKVNPLSYSKAQQYAYWVNLYNSITVNLILQNYPVKSITKLGGFFSFGPWDEKVITINGKELTLNDIEHRILRPIWKDPRTHYAVNCASLGCPNLQKTVFTAQNTNTLLEQAAHTFINSDKGVNVQGNTIVLSSIYKWFASDFGGIEGVKKQIKHYRPDINFSDKKIKYDYNWNLNEAK